MRPLEALARVDLGAEQSVRRAKVYNETGRPLGGYTIRMAFNDAGPRGYHRHYGFTIACSSSIRRPRAEEAPSKTSFLSFVLRKSPFQPYIRLGETLYISMTEKESKGCGNDIVLRAIIIFPSD